MSSIKNLEGGEAHHMKGQAAGLFGLICSCTHTSKILLLQRPWPASPTAPRSRNPGKAACYICPAGSKVHKLEVVGDPNDFKVQREPSKGLLLPLRLHPRQCFPEAYSLPASSPEMIAQSYVAKPKGAVESI